MIKWPNLFLYLQDTGANVTYSKVPQHTWKAGELIREKHWNNLYAPPLFKKVEETAREQSGFDVFITYNILYSEAEKILLNGGILFLIESGQDSGITYNQFRYLSLSNFVNGQNPFIDMIGASYGWDEDSNGYLYFSYDNTK